MTETPNEGQETPTTGQIGTGVGQPATGAESAAQQGADPGDNDAEIRRIAAKEKRSGKQAGMAEALEALGFEDLESATQWVGEYRTIEQEMETEADREKARAERLEQERNTLRERYLNTERRYALRDAFRDAGVPSDRLDDALALAKLDEITVDQKTGEISGVSEVADSTLENRQWLLSGDDGEARQRVSAPATHATGEQRPDPDTPQSSGDTRTDMGRSMLGWLLDPVEDEQTWP